MRYPLLNQGIKRMHALSRSLILACASALFSFSLPVASQEDSGFSGNLALTTDYVFRGYTQTSEKLAVQGGLDWEGAEGWHLGVWGSRLDFGAGDDAFVEVDLYGGYSWQINDVGYDLGLIYYAYPGAGGSADRYGGTGL